MRQLIFFNGKTDSLDPWNRKSNWSGLTASKVMLFTSVDTRMSIFQHKYTSELFLTGL